MLTRTARVVLNAVASYAKFAISMVVVLLLTPFIIRSIGLEAFGLWSLVISTVGFFGLLDLGFGAGVVKIVAECRGSGDLERRNRVLSTLLPVYLSLALIAVLGLVVLSFAFPLIFTVPMESHSTALVLIWLLASRSVVLALPLGIFRGVLFGEQRIYAVNAIEAGSVILYGIGAWFVLSNGYGVLALAVVNLAAMLVEYGAYTGLAYALVPGLRISPALADRRIFSELARFSASTFVINVAALVLLRTDPIIVTFFLPLSAVAVYAIALKISEYTHLLSKQFINILAPFVAELHGSKESDKIRFVLINCTKYALAGALILSVPIWAFAREIVVLWVGPTFVDAAPVLILLTMAMAIAVPQMVASNVLVMTGRQSSTARAATLSVILNVVLSVALVRPLGLIGVALGTLLTTIIVDVFVVLRKACETQGVSAGRYARHAIAAPTVAAAAQWIVTIAIAHALPPESLTQVALEAVPGMAVFAAVFWFAGVDASEKQLFATRLVRFRRVVPALPNEVTS